MGQNLVVPEDCQTKGVSEEDTFIEAVVDLGYDIAHWLECAAHFFHFLCRCGGHVQGGWETSKQGQRPRIRKVCYVRVLLWMSMHFYVF